MTQRQFDSLKFTLEDAIDMSSLTTVAEAIAEVCQDKANQAHHTWQDRHLAILWLAHGRRFTTLADKLTQYDT